MVDRKKGKDEAIENSFDTDVSASTDMGELTEKQKRISTIYELTDIGDLPADAIERIFDSVDLYGPSITDLIKEVQRKVEMILAAKSK